MLQRCRHPARDACSRKLPRGVFVRACHVKRTAYGRYTFSSHLSRLLISVQFLELTMAPPHNPEYALLGGETPTVEATGSTFRTWTAPVFTGDALEALGSDILPQRAIYGRVLDQKVNGFPRIPSSPILYINTNAPFSGLVCGLQVSFPSRKCRITLIISQGAGTSHSTSILLESCLVSDPRLGTLPKPLSALV